MINEYYNYIKCMGEGGGGILLWELEPRVCKHFIETPCI